MTPFTLVFQRVSDSFSAVGTEFIGHKHNILTTCSTLASQFLDFHDVSIFHLDTGSALGAGSGSSLSLTVGLDTAEAEPINSRLAAGQVRQVLAINADRTPELLRCDLAGNSCRFFFADLVLLLKYLVSFSTLFYHNSSLSFINNLHIRS